MTSTTAKRMILKFEVPICLDNRYRSGLPSTSANAVWTIQEEMEIAAESSMHEEVSAHEVAGLTCIPYTTVWLALQRITVSIKNSSSL